MSKTDDEELEIGSIHQDIMTHFWRQKLFHKRQKRTTGLLGHQATIIIHLKSIWKSSIHV